MSIFGYLKLGALLAVLAIIGALAYQNVTLRGDLVTASQTIKDRDGTIERANTQNRDLAQQLVTSARELALSRLQMKVSDAAVAHAADTIAALQSALNDAERSMNDAPATDDGPAAPKLRYAANGMRRFGEALTALRARYDHANGPRGNPDPGGAAADPWPALGWPFTQGQFAARCYDLGEALTVAVGNLAGINDWQAAYNTNVRQFNAANAGATP